MDNNKDQFNINFSQNKKNRYGADELSTLLVIIGLLLMFGFGYYLNMQYINAIAITLLVYALYRMSSTNHVNRKKENDAYLNAKGKVFPFMSAKTSGTQKAKAQTNKKEITCPVCSAHMNIPVGKGSIRVTCPTCKNKFTVES